MTINDYNQHGKVTQSSSTYTYLQDGPAPPVAWSSPTPSVECAFQPLFTKGRKNMAGARQKTCSIGKQVNRQTSYTPILSFAFVAEICWSILNAHPQDGQHRPGECAQDARHPGLCPQPTHRRGTRWSECQHHYTASCTCRLKYHTHVAPVASLKWGGRGPWAWFESLSIYFLNTSKLLHTFVVKQASRQQQNIPPRVA